MEPTQSSPPSSKLHNPAIIPLETPPWSSHFYPHQSLINSFNIPQYYPQKTQNPNQNLVFDNEREPMFEKPLTPSDVGKLNRLVIPKQHAEKYFPLGGDSGDHHKGLLMSFEDELGKCWSFRYSYWNSSQSYVLTKGWSRYVREKKLDAGDIILFERHRRDGDRLFIGWRRRSAAVVAVAAAATEDGGNAGGGNERWSSWGLYQGNPYLGHIQGHGTNFPCQPDSLHAGPMVQNQEPGGNPKRLLRLFGVNLECQLDDSEASTPDSSKVSSQGPTTHRFYCQS